MGTSIAWLLAWSFAVFGGDPRVAELEKDLRSTHPKTRRGAVRELSELADPRAWRLVLEALGDREAEVGDAAQLRIAGASDPRVVDDLFGRPGVGAKDERIARRAAEAIGRLRVDVEAAELVGALGVSDLEARRAVLWSIERLAGAERIAGRREGLLERVEALARGSREPLLVATALHALAALDPQRALPVATRSLEARAVEPRVAALAVIGSIDTPSRFATLAAAFEDPDPIVRAQALASAAAMRDRSAVELLIRAIELEARPRPAWRAIETLQRWSGMLYRRDPRPWRTWLATLPIDWRAPAFPPAPPAQSGDSRVAFAGMSIASDRVAFLVDFSGSMWSERKDGIAVKSVVDAKLADALSGLGEGTLFNVMPYTATPLPWEKELVVANAANRKRALDEFMRCRASGRGNVHDAALLAIADPQVDTLMIWTDGVPTGGVHSDLELVVPLLLERNRFRHVAYDVILVDSPRGATRRWQELALASGGRTIELRLDELVRKDG